MVVEEMGQMLGLLLDDGEKGQGTDLQAPVLQTDQSGWPWGAGTQGAPVSLLFLGQEEQVTIRIFAVYLWSPWLG